MFHFPAHGQHLLYSFPHFCGRVAVLGACEPMEIFVICWCVRLDEFALMLLLLEPDDFHPPLSGNLANDPIVMNTSG